MSGSFRSCCDEKKLFSILFSVLLLLTADRIFSENSFAVSYSQNIVFPRDQKFRQVYGKIILLQELKLQFFFFGDYYLWGSYGFSKKSGSTIPELMLPTRITQHYLAAGLGFSEKFARNVGYKIEAGISWIGYRENVFEIKHSGGGFGIRAEGGLFYSFTKNRQTNA